MQGSTIKCPGGYNSQRAATGRDALYPPPPFTKLPTRWGVPVRSAALVVHGGRPALIVLSSRHVVALREHHLLAGGSGVSGQNLRLACGVTRHVQLDLLSMEMHHAPFL